MKAETGLESFHEVGDVARVEDISTATVRADVRAGRLKVSGITLRGTRLFRSEDVDAYRRDRENRRRERLTKRTRRTGGETA